VQAGYSRFRNFPFAIFWSSQRTTGRLSKGYWGRSASQVVNWLQLQANLSSLSGAKYMKARSFTSAIVSLRGVVCTYRTTLSYTFTLRGMVSMEWSTGNGLQRYRHEIGSINGEYGMINREGPTAIQTRNWKHKWWVWNDQQGTAYSDTDTKLERELAAKNERTSVCNIPTPLWGWEDQVNIISELVSKPLTAS
jgi:hypothetical protein